MNILETILRISIFHHMTLKVNSFLAGWRCTISISYPWLLTCNIRLNSVRGFESYILWYILGCYDQFYITDPDKPGTLPLPVQH